jgi:uncharacterized Zn-finger protein
MPETVCNHVYAEQTRQQDTFMGRFVYNSGLQHHASTHTKEKLYECDLCGIKFCDHGNWMRHERKVSHNIKFRLKLS